MDGTTPGAPGRPGAPGGHLNYDHGSLVPGSLIPDILNGLLTDGLLELGDPESGTQQVTLTETGLAPTGHCASASAAGIWWRRQHGRTNDAYAELLAHLEITFNSLPCFMILGVPAMIRLRDLAERLYPNPYADPDKERRG